MIFVSREGHVFLFARSAKEGDLIMFSSEFLLVVSE